MNRNRRRIALLAPVASIALLAGCAGHSGSTPSSDARSGDSGSFSTAAPEFRSTIVYGLAKSVTPTPDGAKLVWDKGDWQFNVGPIRPACRRARPTTTATS